MKPKTRKIIRILRDFGYVFSVFFSICVSVGGILLLHAEWMPQFISWTFIILGIPTACFIFNLARKDKGDDEMQDLYLESEANRRLNPMVNDPYLNQ